MPRAAVCTALNQPLEVMDLDLEAPRAGEALVRMGASGVCHSDVSMQNGTIFAAMPMVLGHEGAGVIEEVGDGVEGLAPGDHVVISWVPQCGTCFFCRRGQAYLCAVGTASMASGGLLDNTTRFSRNGKAVRQMLCAGTFAERSVIPAISAVKVDDDLPQEIGALIGCGVLTGVGAALNTADIAEGDTVVVMGCGGVGLNVIMGAKIAGAAEIVAVDMVADKLELAARFGATQTIDASEGDPLKTVMKMTGQRGADVAFEVIGLKETIAKTIRMTRRGGQAILVGVPSMDVMIEMPAFLGAVLSAKTIKGCWYGSSNVQDDVPRLIGYYRSGQLPLDDLISRRIELGDVNDAFRAMQAGEVARSVICY